MSTEPDPDAYRNPRVRLRQWCVEQAPNFQPVNAAAAFEAAAALERFVLTGDYRRYPQAPADAE